MNGELAVLGILRDDATVSGIVDGRISLDQAEETDILPYIVVEQSGDDPFATKDGMSAKDHDRVRVFPYAATRSELRTLYEACRTALDGKTAGTYNGVDVEWIMFQSQTSFTEEIENKKAFAKDQEYIVRVVL